MERFDELARGASELQVIVERGDIAVRVAEGAGWSLEWSGDGAGEPEVERDGPVIRVRQQHRHHDGFPEGDVTFSGGNFVADDESFKGRAFVHGLVGEVMREIGGLAGRRMDVRLTIPAGIERVELRTGMGKIDATGTQGRLLLTTGMGALALQSAGGEAELKTGNGDVRITEYDGTITATTGNGDLVLTGVAGEAELSSGHGQVRIGAARALDVRASAGMGAIRVEGGSVRALRLNSGMGEVSCSAELAPGAHELRTGMGDISLELAATARARIEAQTGMGQVRSDFPLVRVGRSGPLSFGGVRMVGSIGEGDPELDLSLRSGKGDISLRRARAYAPASTAGVSAVRPAQRPADVRPVQEPAAAPARSEQPTPAADGGPMPAPDSTLSVLEALARGEITPAQAEDLLSRIP